MKRARNNKARLSHKSNIYRKPEDLQYALRRSALGSKPPSAVQKRMILLRNAAGATSERMPSNTLVYDCKGRRIGTIADLRHRRERFADKVLIFGFRR